MVFSVFVPVKILSWKKKKPDQNFVLPGSNFPSACNLIFTRSVGFAIALPIEPDIAPDITFLYNGVFDLSFSPNNSLNGSYNPNRMVL